jgi:glycosyltransferase involved in cell wall biosynthesis
MAQKTSILYIISNLSLGGMERSLYYLLKYSDRSLFTISVWSLSARRQELVSPIRALGIDVHVWGIEKVNSWDTMTKLPALVQDLRARRPQVVVCYSFDAELVGVPLGRLLGVPVVLTTRRDMGDWERADSQLKYRKWLDPWTARIVAVSDRVKAAVVAHEGVAPNRVRTIYNGIDETFFDTPAAGHTRQAWNIDPDDVVVTLVGNVVYEVKGHRHFIEAARLVLAAEPHVTFVVVGYADRTTALFKELDAVIRRLGMEKKIHFTGPTGNVPELIALSDICVNASLSEGMSNAVLEYMALGKPVVVTDVGGNPEVVVDGLNGLVVPPADAPALADALLKLVRDRKLRIVMGDHGRERQRKEFTAKRMAGEYEKLYWELLE